MTARNETDKEISDEELLALQTRHDIITHKVFNYFQEDRGCKVIEFAGFLCEDVLPEDLFKLVLEAKIEKALQSKNASEERVQGLDLERKVLNKKDKEKRLNENIDACQSLMSMVSMVKGKRVKSYGLKPKKTYNNLVKRS